MKNLRVIIIVILVMGMHGGAFSQNQNPVKKFSSRKAPKISISFLGGFNYVFSRANGDGSGFKASYDPAGGNVFVAENLGMQQGYGVMTIGKFAVDKKRKLRVTGNLGYSLFYNTFDTKRNRTIWNIINIGSGIEYNFSPKQKEKLFVGCEANYSILFGAWQSDITYPDNSVSNIYTKFKPASRFGVAVTTGMEIKINRKIDLVFALRGVWSNIFPKQNYESTEPYLTYINDSQNKNGIELKGSKDIVFMQILTGITLPISYK